MLILDTLRSGSKGQPSLTGAPRSVARYPPLTREEQARSDGGAHPSTAAAVGSSRPASAHVPFWVTYGCEPEWSGCSPAGKTGRPQSPVPPFPQPQAPGPALHPPVPTLPTREDAATLSTTRVSDALLPPFPITAGQRHLDRAGTAPMSKKPMSFPGASLDPVTPCRCRQWII